MSLHFNSIEITQTDHDIVFNGVTLTAVVQNGTTIWAKYGSQVFDTAGSYTFDVPEGISELNVCAIAGGGSGASIYGYTSAVGVYGGGGFAGEIYSGKVPVVGGTTIDIIVGAGGAAHGGLAVGNKGGNTVIGSKTLTGGNGGNYTTGGGATATGGNSNNCFGSFVGGGTAINYSGNDFICYGGQAGFANGTSGSLGGTSNATMGAGSGCAGNNSTAGKGGDGYVKIEWGNV